MEDYLQFLLEQEFTHEQAVVLMSLREEYLDTADREDFTFEDFHLLCRKMLFSSGIFRNWYKPSGTLHWTENDTNDFIINWKS